MCEYCENKKAARSVTFNGDTSFSIFKNQLYVDGDIVFKISYCPICRKEAGIMQKLKVKKIREVIKNLPDETECELSSDTGLDQCVYEEDVVPVLEECFVSNGKLIIYGNWQ